MDKVGMIYNESNYQGVTRLLTHKVVGPGTLAISSYGGLCRLVLSEKEEYLVNPKCVALILIR